MLQNKNSLHTYRDDYCCLKKKEYERAKSEIMIVRARG